MVVVVVGGLVEGVGVVVVEGEEVAVVEADVDGAGAASSYGGHVSLSVICSLSHSIKWETSA